MLENKLNSTMFSYYNNLDIKNTWDIAQHEVSDIYKLVSFLCVARISMIYIIKKCIQLECCGMQGPSDWYRVTKNDSLPHTCCPDTQNDGSCSIKSANKYNSSCFEKLEAVFVQYGSIIGGIGIGIAISQVKFNYQFLIIYSPRL